MTRPVGELLRGWREHRRLSQLQLAIQADISTRHLSFVETGRSRPSRVMVLHLADELDVPLRERNRLYGSSFGSPSCRLTADTNSLGRMGFISSSWRSPTSGGIENK